MSKTCKNCGAELKDEDEFCNKCGEKYINKTLPMINKNKERVKDTQKNEMKWTNKRILSLISIIVVGVVFAASMLMYIYYTENTNESSKTPGVKTITTPETTCKICGGDGEITSNCIHCGGDGKVISIVTCDNCKGSGSILEPVEKELKYKLNRVSPEWIDLDESWFNSNHGLKWVGTIDNLDNEGGVFNVVFKVFYHTVTDEPVFISEKMCTHYVDSGETVIFEITIDVPDKYYDNKDMKSRIRTVTESIYDPTKITEELINCPACDGTGKIEKVETCTICQGNGKIHTTCSTCGGTGIV